MYIRECEDTFFLGRRGSNVQYVSNRDKCNGLTPACPLSHPLVVCVAFIQLTRKQELGAAQYQDETVLTTTNTRFESVAFLPNRNTNERVVQTSAPLRIPTTCHARYGGFAQVQESCWCRFRSFVLPVRPMNGGLNEVESRT